MSSIKLTADTGGGTFEIKAPSSGSNTRVLTVPDSANGTFLTTTNPKAGNIIQIVQTVKTSFFSTANLNSSEEVTGANVSITPSSASNKILISVSGYYGNQNNDSFASLNLGRQIDSGSVDKTILLGDARGSSTRCTMGASLRNGGGDSDTVGRHFGIDFLDSPNTTGVCKYTLFFFMTQGGPGCIGGTATDGDSNRQSFPTILTAMEVAG